MPSPNLFRHLCADLLRGGQAVRFRATGPSMSPVIRDGDIVTVAPVGRSVRRGDILLYSGERGLTAHRVVGWRTECDLVFRVRGDAIGSPVERVEAARALGIVQAVERGGRRISQGRPLMRGVARLVRRCRGVLSRAVRSRNWVESWRQGASDVVRLSDRRRGTTP